MIISNHTSAAAKYNIQKAKLSQRGGRARGMCSTVRYTTIRFINADAIKSRHYIFRRIGISHMSEVLPFPAALLSQRRAGGSKASSGSVPHTASSGNRRVAGAENAEVNLRDALGVQPGALDMQRLLAGIANVSVRRECSKNVGVLGHNVTRISSAGHCL